MKNSKSKKKAIALSFGVTAMLLTATNLNAQYLNNRGLFGRGSNAEYGNRNYSEMQLTVNTQDFGQDVPLGSGIVILIGTGLCYVVLKKRRTSNEKADNHLGCLYADTWTFTVQERTDWPTKH